MRRPVFGLAAKGTRVMPKYTVKDSAGLVHHNGRPYGPGDKIELSPDEALRLSAIRALKGADVRGLRAAHIRSDGNTIFFSFIHDAPLTDELREACEVASSEVISDFHRDIEDIREAFIVGNTPQASLGLQVFPMGE